MHAITVRQPWARAIAVGIKAVENRGRLTSYRGPVAIHAGKVIDGNAERDRRIVELFGRDASIGQPLGAVVAVATLVDCHRAPYSALPLCCVHWGERLYQTPKTFKLAWHLVLAVIRPLPEPVYVRGQQAVPWTLPPEVAEKVAAQLNQEAPSA